VVLKGKLLILKLLQKKSKKLKDELYQIISLHTGQPFDKVERDGDRDFWMRSDEAKEYGMIDEVLSRTKLIFFFNYL